MSEALDVVHYCPSAQGPCGVQDYTDRLATALGHSTVTRLEEIAPERPLDVLHVQHEFGLFSETLLDETIAWAGRRGVTLYFTLHTVVQIPRRIHRLRRWAQRGLPLSPWRDGPAAGSRPWDWFLAPNTRAGRSNARSLGRILASADGIVVHSPLARELLTRSGADPGRVEVRFIGIDRPLYSPEPADERPRPRRIGYFGFLKPHKGVRELIEACSTIEDVGLELLACDSGEVPDFVSEIRQLVRERPWVRLDPRHLPLQEVVERLSRCDVNVYPSRETHFASSSAAIRQYVQAGRPIVAFDTAWVDEIGHALQLVPDGDLSALARAVASAPAAAPQLRELAELLSWERQMPRYQTAKGNRPLAAAAADSTG